MRIEARSHHYRRNHVHVLVVLFAITTLMAAGIYSMKSKDLTETQEELSTVQQELQEAQEAAK